MKQTKEAEDKEFFDSIDQFSLKELLVSIRKNLGRVKKDADAANNRTRDMSKDLINMEQAFVVYMDRIDGALKELDIYLNLPWYKKIFYKRNK